MGRARERRADSGLTPEPPTIIVREAWSTQPEEQEVKPRQPVVARQRTLAEKFGYGVAVETAEQKEQRKALAAPQEGKPRPEFSMIDVRAGNGNLLERLAARKKPMH